MSPSERAHPVPLVHAPVSRTGQAPQVRHDEKGQTGYLSGNVLSALLHLRQAVPEALLLPDERFNGKENHCNSGRQKEY